MDDARVLIDRYLDGVGKHDTTYMDILDRLNADGDRSDVEVIEVPPGFAEATLKAIRLAGGPLVRAEHIYAQDPQEAIALILDVASILEHTAELAEETDPAARLELARTIGALERRIEYLWYDWLENRGSKEAQSA